MSAADWSNYNGCPHYFTGTRIFRVRDILNGSFAQAKLEVFDFAQLAAGWVELCGCIRDQGKEKQAIQACKDYAHFLLSERSEL